MMHLTVTYADEYGEVLCVVETAHVPTKGDSVVLDQQHWVKSVEWWPMQGAVTITLSESRGHMLPLATSTMDQSGTNRAIGQATALANTALAESKKTKTQVKSLTERLAVIDHTMRRK